MKTEAIKQLLMAKAKGVIPKPALVADAGNEAIEMISTFIDTLGRLASAIEAYNESQDPGIMERQGHAAMSAEEARAAGYDL